MTLVARCILIAWFSIAPAYADDDGLTAQRILAQMIHAMESLNYDGTVVLLRNGKLETMKYFHAVAEGREQERLVSLNSPRREIVRNGNWVSCRYQDSKTVVSDHRPYERSFLIDFLKKPDEMNDLYDFVLSGEEEVAMVASYIVDIRPKDALRYARRIWVEKNRYLPLKITLYDAGGELLEQVMFTEQHVQDALPFSDEAAASELQSDRATEQDGHDPGARPFSVAHWPPGFKEIYFTRRTMHNSRLPVDHLRMSDGLASVSVYMEHKTPDMASGLRSIGAINSYSRDVDDYQVTVMGDVPPSTVKSIAEGIGVKNIRH